LKLFENGTCSDFVSAKAEELKKEISAMSDERIVNDDRDQWIDYLVDKYSIEPVSLHRESAERNLEETSLKKRNPWYKRGIEYLEPEYYVVPSYRVTCKIPYEGNRELFDKRPNPFALRIYEVDSLGSTWRDDDPKILTIHFDFEKSVLDNQADVGSYVDDSINKELDAIEEALARNGNEAKAFNSGLNELVVECLNKRASRASDLAKLAGKLQINLNQKKNAPINHPVKLNQTGSSKREKPLAKRAKTEPYISTEDYSNICNIIDLSCVSFERSSETIKKLSEEEIRDLILSHLNSHYDGTASGETFRRTGKTDILIPLNGKAAFVAECKVWHGRKNFLKAIEQLLSYSTWRDSKLAVVIFNKDNKDFQKVLETIAISINDFSSSFKRIEKNIWLCRIYRTDSADEVFVKVMVYDLHLD
jgi:hypothetical protein